MELNLNELERRAKSAGGQEWTLTIDATGDAFLSAENSEYVAEVGAVGEDGIVSDYGKFIAAANPAVVLELVRRLRDAEARVAELEADRAERERQEPVATVERITHGSYHQNVRLTWHRHVKTGQKLYAAPPVTAPVRLKREEFELPEGNGLAHISPTGWIAMKEYARAVETAVLRANGFDIQTQEGK